MALLGAIRNKGIEGTTKVVSQGYEISSNDIFLIISIISFIGIAFMLLWLFYELMSLMNEKKKYYNRLNSKEAKGE